MGLADGAQLSSTSQSYLEGRLNTINCMRLKSAVWSPFCGGHLTSIENHKISNMYMLILYGQEVHFDLVGFGCKKKKLLLPVN